VTILCACVCWTVPIPDDPTKLGFTALIDGVSHPFRMDLDGRNKIDLTASPIRLPERCTITPSRRLMGHAFSMAPSARVCDNSS